MENQELKVGQIIELFRITKLGASYYGNNFFSKNTIRPAAIAEGLSGGEFIADNKPDMLLYLSEKQGHVKPIGAMIIKSIKTQSIRSQQTT